MDFCHLHVHSENSWFDSIIRIPHLIQAVLSSHMKAIGLTDHHHMMGWASLEKCAEEKGVKPVFGMEINVETYHLTALAMTEKGMENLIILNNLGRTRGKVFVTQTELLLHKEGLFFLSGCSKGMLSQAYYQGGPHAVKEVVDRCVEWFPGCFAIELSTSRLPFSFKEVLQTIAAQKGLLLVPTNDCHYIRQEDESVYAQNLWLRTRGKIVHPPTDKHIRTPDEMACLYPTEWLHNTMTIANRCQVSYQDYLHQAPKLPVSRVYPLALIERYNDEESMQLVYETQKEYKKAHRVMEYMRRSLLTLEDLVRKEEYHPEVRLAFGIRHLIKQVRADERYGVAVQQCHLPLFQHPKTSTPFLQWTLEEAIHWGATIIEKKERTSG